ncbi:MAG: TetR/AcrR family transcriptional regulator [Acidimicrobiales bacterium]|nr:TetR/AcrR family transcriptional regulator [Acidimicrobiales bacterium]
MLDAEERILDAAVEAAAVHGITRLSVADVAKRAGLSRPTLYKHFPSKEALIAAAVQREAGAMVGAVNTVVDGIDEPRAALRAGVLLALRLVRDHPLLDRVVRTEPEVLVPLLTTDEGLVMSAIRLPVEQMVARKFPHLDAVAVRRLADILTRLLVSYALNAPDDPPEIVAALVAAVLADGAASLPSIAAHTVTEETR